MAESKAKKITQIELFESMGKTTSPKALNHTHPLHRERIQLENKYEALIEEKPELSRLVSFQGNKNVPLLRLYRYKEAFSFELVKKFLKEFSAVSSSYVFDPFCGMGTTLLASMSQKIPSLGIDLLPMAVFIAKTIPIFLQLSEKENLEKIADAIIVRAKKSKPAEIAEQVKIIKLAFDSDTLIQLRKIKSAIEELSEPLKQILTLIFFSILEEVSYTSKDGQFLRLELDKKILSPAQALVGKAREAQQDLIRAKNFFRLSAKDLKRYFPRVYEADSKSLSKIPFKREPDIIITSPPYANRYDYTRSYALELCFHFVKNFEELKSIRHRILRSHIESKITDKDIPVHPALEEIILALSEKELNNPKIPDLLVGYFCDMASAIKEWSRVLAKGAKVAMVVDNVRFEGEMVPVDLILSELGEQSGFKIQKIFIARYKGNSSQQMKKYGREPVRESIVVWSKK